MQLGTKCKDQICFSYDYDYDANVSFCSAFLSGREVRPIQTRDFSVGGAKARTPPTGDLLCPRPRRPPPHHLLFCKDWKIEKTFINKMPKVLFLNLRNQWWWLPLWYATRPVNWVLLLLMMMRKTRARCCREMRGPRGDDEKGFVSNILNETLNRDGWWLCRSGWPPVVHPALFKWLLHA